MIEIFSYFFTPCKLPSSIQTPKISKYRKNSKQFQAKNLEEFLRIRLPVPKLQKKRLKFVTVLHVFAPISFGSALLHTFYTL